MNREQRVLFPFAAALVLSMTINCVYGQTQAPTKGDQKKWSLRSTGSQRGQTQRTKSHSSSEKYILHPSLTGHPRKASLTRDSSRSRNPAGTGRIPLIRPASSTIRVQTSPQPRRGRTYQQISQLDIPSNSSSGYQLRPGSNLPPSTPAFNGQQTEYLPNQPQQLPQQPPKLIQPPSQNGVPAQPPEPAAVLAPQFVFNFNNAPWQLVLRQFSQQFGMSLQMSHQVAGEFTYFDQRAYTVPEAIDIFNDYLLPQGAILIHHADKLTLAGANTEIPDGFIPFVRITDLPRIGRNHLATIAIELDRAEPTAAAEEISKFLSPVGRVEPLSNSQRVVVTDTGAYLRRIFDLVTGAGIASPDPKSSVYELRHAPAEEVAKAINEFYAQQMGGSNGAGGEPQQIVIAEKSTKSIIIRDVGGKGSEVYSLIQQLDRPPKQVLIQALIVEVQLGNTHELGVELGFQDSVLFNRSIINDVLTVTETTTAPGGIQTTNQRILSQSAAPGFNFNNQPLGNNVAVSPSTVAGQALSSFGVGRVNGDLGYGGLVLSAGSESINVLLRALTTRFDVDILSRPQVRAVDNHEALIQIGQQVPVVDGVSVTANGSANPVIRQDKAGIILKVTPQISPELNVLIDVQAEKSAFQLAPGTGVPIFTDATNGNVIEAPVKDITTANTLVSVRSGQTIVLGGMITNEESVVERKVPFLGDIPIIKHAFRHDIRNSTRKELLIFLTPHVIESDCHSRQLDDEVKSHVHIPGSAYEFPDLGGGGHSMGQLGDGCEVIQQ